MPRPARPYRGVSAEDRRASRRQALLDAALELVSAPDHRPVTMTAVCERAGLTERYFYESFPDRDALVLAVYEQVADEALQTLHRVTDGITDRVAIARASVEAMVALMVDDPRKGRVLLVAPITEPTLAGRVIAHAPTWAFLIRQQLSPDASEEDRDLISTGLVGTLTSLFFAYLAGTLQVSRAAFVDHLVRVLLTAKRLES